eukprot:14082153-Alexandrium_andersonii.AAC.1
MTHVLKWRLSLGSDSSRELSPRAADWGRDISRRRSVWGSVAPLRSPTGPRRLVPNSGRGGARAWRWASESGT